MMRWILLGCAFMVGACQPDETLSGFVDPTTRWVLKEVHGVPYAHEAYIVFPEEGRISGQAPCNSFSASLTTPYPWVSLGPMMVTRMMCPDMDAERAFFEALGSVTLAEAQGDVLILSKGTDPVLIFHAEH